MRKVFTFLMLSLMLVPMMGCESHRSDDIQEEQERPQNQRPPTEGNSPGIRG